MGKICSTCGSENKPEAQFCAVCGQKLEVQGAQDNPQPTPGDMETTVLVRSQPVTPNPVDVGAQAPQQKASQPKVKVTGFFGNVTLIICGAVTVVLLLAVIGAGIYGLLLRSRYAQFRRTSQTNTHVCVNVAEVQAAGYWDGGFTE